MFDVSWSELLVIAAAALIFIGPKELPGVLRTVGQFTSKIRRMASEFQDQFREAMREAEMADLKKDIDEAAGKAGSGLDPFADLKESMEWKPPAPTTPPAADAPPAPPAEAIVEPAPPAPDAPAQAPASPPPPDTVQGDAAPGEPPAGGDRAA